MAAARNYTIDDSQWATPPLQLSAGWNMLRTGGSDEYINATQVDAMRPLLGNFWNESLSWSTTENASVTLTFVGTDIWAYGMSGPSQGYYTAILNNKTVGQYTAQADDVDYNYLLFAAHDLPDGQTHYLTLMNSEQSTSLAFDMAMIKTSEDVNIMPSSSSSPSSTVATSAASQSTANPLAQMLNGTSPDANAGGLNPALLPTQYSAEQLSSLAVAYHFHWNAAAYFVVIFSSLMVAMFAVFLLHFATRSWGIQRRKANQVGEGESYLIAREPIRPRPSTRIIEALKRGKISNPMPSEDGHSDVSGRRRDSTGTGDSYGDNQVAQGW